MAKQRLDKFLSTQKGLSRSEARAIIRKIGLYVNGTSVFDPSFVFDPNSSSVIFRGEKIKYKNYVYILMNKPKGVLSASEDKSRRTVVDLVPDELKRRQLAPIGRLDKDTTGLILLTDDGIFSHNCISPSKSVEKAYEAVLDGDITAAMIELFAKGIILADGTACKSAILERIGENRARITITEGKYHQIKRMLGTVGLGVVDLKRIRIGKLILPEYLKEGDCVEIDRETAQSALFPSEETTFYS